MADEQKLITLTEKQLYAIIGAVLADVVYHLIVNEPDRTLTARKLINPAVMQIEVAHETRH